jgi:hypothetical protein
VVLACLSIVLGAALVGLAVPRTVAAWEAVAAHAALTKFTKASPAELREGVAGLSRAVTWIASSRYLTGLGTLELLLAEALPPADATRAGLLASAERHLVEGLAAGPLDGLNWYRLAEVRAARGAERRAIVDALMKSLDLAPNMRGLWIDRTVALLRDRRLLTPDETAALNSQIRRIWPVDATFRTRIVTTLRGDRPSLEALRQALGRDSEAQAELGRLLQ